MEPDYYTRRNIRLATLASFAVALAMQTTDWVDDYRNQLSIWVKNKVYTRRIHIESPDGRDMLTFKATPYGTELFKRIRLNTDKSDLDIAAIVC